MIPQALPGPELRTLVLAPIGRDAAVAAAILTGAGIATEICSDLAALSRELADGAATAVITEEAAPSEHLHALAAWVAAQPPWSDFPFVLLTRQGGGPERTPSAARFTEVLGNVSFLERPFHPTTFVSVVRTALRGRLRQYEARAYLDERVRVADELRGHRECLQDLVAERTRALEEANRRLVAEAAERERIEARLRQAQKMEAVGQLTGGIAHDFNNLLSAIVGSLELICGRTSEPRIIRLASNALTAAERGARLTGQLLAFSRMQRLSLAPVDLNRLVEGMRELLERSLGPAIALEIVPDPAVDAALADANQLELAILNLAINARDAMPEGGRLTVKTAQTRPGGDGDAVPAVGDFVSVSVVDTGTGMPPEVLERAFEPFYTTKGIGKGTGLGLSQVYGIAEQSGGTVSIESQPGHGTAVHVLLPRAGPAAALAGRREAARAAGTPPAAPAESRRSETVLVVDDDADVRRFLVESLDSLGFGVVEAEHGHAGLEALAGQPTPDLMILDFAMPGMTGTEVAREALRRRPGLPIVIATGYADTAALDGDLCKLPLLRKPFHMGELVHAIEEMLPGRGC